MFSTYNAYFCFHILKKLVAFISVLFATVCSFGQINDENAFFEGTYNKNYIRKLGILSVTKTSYLDTNKQPTTIYNFDKNGLLKNQSIIDSNGKEQPRFLFTFNKYGDLTQRITLPYENFKADTFIAIREYKEKKVIKERSTYSPFTTQHLYNKKGNRIRTVHPYNNGHITFSRRIIDYEYDQTGKLVHVTDRICNGPSDKIEQWMSDRTITYSGDNMKKIIEKIPNGEFPTNNGTVEYSYDSSGNLISIVSDTVVSRYYNYDNKGLLKIKKEKFPNGLDTFSDASIINEYTYSFRR